VIDDGSSDGTAEILKSFGDKITYIRQENRGAHAAINRGIKVSSGEYIATLDSDDAWLPNRLEQQMKAFEHNPEAGLVYSQAYIIDAEGKNKGERIGKPLPDPERAYESLLRDAYIPVISALIRRECMEQVGGFSESLKVLSDWDLFIRISARWPIVFVPEALALYRDHGNNTQHMLLKSGLAYKERLVLLKNAAEELSASNPKRNQILEEIDTIFRELALKTAYGLWYRYQYSKAASYLLFAVRLRPWLFKDVLLAIRPRSISRLLVGIRGVDLLNKRTQF
jgi:glycosyltransferase involved in cell wall biosynthesis